MKEKCIKNNNDDYGKIDYEKVVADLGCIRSLAQGMETLLDEIDHDNVINTKFRIGVVYDLCYILEELTTSIQNKVYILNGIERK